MTYQISYDSINMKLKKEISHISVTDTNPLKIPFWNICNFYLMVCLLMNTDASRCTFTGT
jgi:hypothetical protein